MVCKSTADPRSPYIDHPKFVNKLHGKCNTGLDYTWLRYFLPIFPKIAVRQTVGGRGAAEGNTKLCQSFSPTQCIKAQVAPKHFLS